MQLKVRDISFYYDSFKAVDRVSFEVKSGLILGIVGPNGSGKTTLLRCINKALKPKTGTVFLDDINLVLIKQKEVAQKIGVVPQNSINRFPFTVFDIVLMGRFPHLGRFEKETEKDFDMVQRCLKLTGVERLASRLITEISGGEHQKVIIAKALAQEPKVLLLDEPTLHLDINYQIELLDLLKILVRDENLIVVMVSHDLNLAARYCDRILILKEGKIFQVGLPEEVLTRQCIKEVYGVETEIIRSPTAGSLNIFPVCTIKK
ncbi:MAG: ABC transporter ATP-binding protein [Candidatus Omnitrophica bacterium]|nr:ABC transporter ATP-binding protein [Candidatus Omnitrophota bacterium]